jgi:hypothetical protein
MLRLRSESMARRHRPGLHLQGPCASPSPPNAVQPPQARRTRLSNPLRHAAQGRDDISPQCSRRAVRRDAGLMTASPSTCAHNSPASPRVRSVGGGGVVTGWVVTPPPPKLPHVTIHVTIHVFLSLPTCLRTRPSTCHPSQDTCLFTCCPRVRPRAAHVTALASLVSSGSFHVTPDARGACPEPCT